MSDADYTEGKQAGAAAERERFKTVLNSRAYKGREASALHMLFGSNMSAQQIINLLETLSSGAPSSWAKSIAKANARVA